MDTRGRSAAPRSGLSAEDLQRIERYLAGELGPAETETFGPWAASDPARQSTVIELTKLWKGSGPTVAQFDVDAMWARVLPSLQRRTRVLSLITRDSHPWSRWSGWAGIPRAVVAALILSSIALAGGIAINRRRHDATPFPGMRTFSTRRGQRANLQLDNGTQVVLGAATTVKIADDYGDLARNVYLNGEAYFIVRHDSARAFIVHAGHALVRNVGTQFAVTAYAGATTTQVVVAEGTVAVAHTELRASDVAIIDTSGRFAVVHHGANVPAAIGWTQGRFAFEAAPFREVAASLSRWYDLDIELADSTIGRQALTVTFGSESTHQVLDALALLTHTRYAQRGRTVTFSVIPGT